MAFEARIYDPRVGRFLSVDPLTKDYPHQSPYVYAANNPIRFIDALGKASEDPFEKFIRVHLWNMGRWGQIAEGDLYGQYSSPYEERNINGGVRFWVDMTVLMTGHVELVRTMTQMPQGRPTASSTIRTVGLSADEAALFSSKVISPSYSSTLAGKVEAEAPAVNLQQRANEIHSALPAATQRRTTTAVGEAVDASGNVTYLVGSSEDRLRPAQRAILNPAEIAIKGKGHAEATIVNYANQNNLKLNSVGASRPICAGCAATLNSNNVLPASPLKSSVKPLKKFDASSYMPSAGNTSPPGP